MTNNKIRKTESNSKDAVHLNGSDLSNAGIDRRNWINSIDNEYLTKNMNASKYIHEITEDADDVNNDSTTSTSFSLEECMNEFRARRIRRTSLSQHRKDLYKNDDSSRNGQGTAELDLIKQNLCNKEQERKCKPCQNGFCYCFTSDSGDGSGNLVGLYSLAGIPPRNTRRRNRSECIQLSNSGITKSSLSRKESKKVGKTTCLKSATKSTKRLKVINSLETSTRDAPFIHIIQELRDNCVISKVNVNQHKIQSFVNNARDYKITAHNTPKKAAFKNQEKVYKSTYLQSKSSDTRAPEEYSPTAPVLENFLDSEIMNAMSPLDDNRKCYDCSKQRRKSGGQLLQKRLSLSKLNYKPKDTNQAPRKPPRTLTYNDEYCMSSSSTSSVRKAEKVIDIFLSKNGVKESFVEIANKLKKNAEHQENIQKIESANKKTHPLNLHECKRKTENNIFTYSALSDMEGIKESKKFILNDKNIGPSTESAAKVINIGWNEAKIKDMLNYEVNTQHTDFHSTSVRAQAQHLPSTDLVDKNNSLGWRIPPKIDLDTVDGIVHHNLASNLEAKNTPVKTKVISPSKNKRDGSRKQKFIWLEQLRHLSPWSNKYNVNDMDDSKQNLRCSPKAFIRSSKKKLVRLISPKKENRARTGKQISKSPNRNVGVQTSYNNVSGSLDNIHNPYHRSSSPQSPPGSYHSPMQSSHIKYPFSTQSQDTTPNEPALTQFDFSRTVRSPPKKVTCSSQRKLNFPLNCTFLCKDDDPQNSRIYTSSEDLNQKKTYRSFNSELEQDVSLSKISYILSNIRAKLEASDQQAMNIFLEADSNVDHNALVFDCADIHHKTQTEERIELHKYLQPSGTREDNLNDPIYSEIEDDSFFIQESADFDNHTSIQHFVTADNPDIMYAKVNKRNKQIMDENNSNFEELTSHIPLAKIMHDSFKSKKITTKFVPLPTLPEPSGSESTSYSQPLSHCQSLNNVRVMEQNSSPKKQRNLSKSDLSLNRSEIFLENLCKSELVVNSWFDKKSLEKVQNDKKNTLNRSYISIIQPCPSVLSRMSPKPDQEFTDTVSCGIPKEEEVNGFHDLVDVDKSTTAGSNLGLNTIVPLSTNNQSTPKKQSFVTKDKTITSDLGIDAEANDSSHRLNNGFQTAPCKQTGIFKIERQNLSHSPILNAVYKYEAMETSNQKTVSALKRYKSLKNVLHKSFQRSKNFIINERNRLSTLNFSINDAIVRSTLAPSKQSYIDSNVDLNLEALFSLNEAATVNEQIAQTVSICRMLPDLEISMEMVEAERLLLFSALRRKNQVISLSTARNCSIPQMPRMHFFIDDMFLPVLSNVNQDIIFNYFYIITFECEGVIKSTQSAECVNGTAVFRDSGIEFMHCSDLKMETLETNQNAVKCNIFMLRLRKLSTDSSQLKKSAMTEHLTETPSSTLKSTSSSTSSLNEVVSRFRLHATFTLDAKNFLPYEYVHQESNSSDRICIRSSCFCTLPLTNQVNSTNLTGQLRLKGRAEMRVLKHVFNGFLSVQDPDKQHNWNRRWCTLDGIFLYVWQDKDGLNTFPLIAINLKYSKHNINYPLTCSPRELCARPRSFRLKCKMNEASEEFLTDTVFFAADTLEDLHDWLKNLNVVLDFIATWMK